MEASGVSARRRGDARLDRARDDLGRGRFLFRAGRRFRGRRRGLLPLAQERDHRRARLRGRGIVLKRVRDRGDREFRRRRDGRRAGEHPALEAVVGRAGPRREPTGGDVAREDGSRAGATAGSPAAAPGARARRQGGHELERPHHRRLCPGRPGVRAPRVRGCRLARRPVHAAGAPARRTLAALLARRRVAPARVSGGSRVPGLGTPGSPRGDRRERVDGGSPRAGRFDDRALLGFR